MDGVKTDDGDGDGAQNQISENDGHGRRRAALIQEARGDTKHVAMSVI